ncbi:MAG: VOC family protein [Gammaproteobacteria bacterium]|nr:VOC family protein [Gammaproteobacteria bacterium]
MHFIDHLVITIADYATTYPVYAAICGCEPAGHQADDGSARVLRFYLGVSMVELAEPVGRPGTGVGAYLQRRLDASGPGVHLICLPSDSPSTVAMDLENAGARILRIDDHLYVHPKSANGVLVQLTPRREFGPPSLPGDARLDHIAIVVKDLAQAEPVWSSITGVKGEAMGVHPASNGSFVATRFLMGEQMIELVSPVDGIESRMAGRLAQRGEGIMAVALPADDLDRTLERVRSTGSRVLWQDPHWMVHPKDAAGVLIQLTPRIEH